MKRKTNTEASALRSGSNATLSSLRSEAEASVRAKGGPDLRNIPN